MSQLVLEGQWEDILSRNGRELAGKWVKVYVEPDQPGTESLAHAPNEQALSSLAELAILQEGMRHTSASETDRLLREARDGGMYGLDPSE